MNKKGQYQGLCPAARQDRARPACSHPCQSLSAAATFPGPLSLYIHVPFCIRKCPYCDFFSVTDLSLVPAYVAGVCKEIRLRGTRAGPWARTPVQTVYFGGGTPSLLSLDQVRQILDSLQRYFCLTDVLELTFELNPGTVNFEYLAGLRHLGINRVSIGAQSFDSKKLEFLSRIHTRNQVKDAITFAARAGFTNLGLDLMYALPGETDAVWQKDLDTALEFWPAHLSCYMLTLEPGTPFFDRYKKGLLHPSDADRRIEFFVHTSRILESAGFIHYEVSNFAKDETSQSIHNSHYWKRGAYLGIGPSAHSFLPGVTGGLSGPVSVSSSISGSGAESKTRAASGKPTGLTPVISRCAGPKRSWNVPDIQDWLAYLEAGRLPRSEYEILTPAQELMEQVMLGLRTKSGIPVKNSGKDLQAKMATLADQDLGIFFHSGDKGPGSQRFRLTRSGLACLDSIVDAFACQIL
jgi:oxygen-independent coproporphyrinogen III oxidase